VWRVLSEAQKLISWFQYQAPRQTVNNGRHHHGYLILAVFILLLIPSPLFAQQPQYKVIQIPVQLRDAGYGCLNDSTVVAGVDAAWNAFMWKQGVITYLPDLGGDVHETFDINNNSVIVGRVRSPCTPGCNDYAVFWSNGALNMIPAPPEYLGVAHGINSIGTIVGEMFENDSVHVLWWSPFIYDGSLTILNEGRLFSDINDNNAAIGLIDVSGEHDYVAYIYQDGNSTYLSTTSGVEGSFEINNSNHVLGYDINDKVCLWKDGNRIPLGLSGRDFAPMSFQKSGGINDHDVVVSAVGSIGSKSAAIWDNGRIRYLDSLIDPNLGIHLKFGCDINNKGEILCIGSDNTMYLLLPDKALTIRDAKNDTIPNVEFNLIRVANNPPVFTEDTLGLFTTDGEGRLELTEVAVDTFTVDLSTGTKQLVVGDSLKIAKHVQSVPAAKHPMTLGTMYSVHLDNAHFDEDGEMHFDTLTASGMEVVLNHTELRYNLLASVEWEATGDYLGSLENNFRYMSNYLYDVTDGQLRLDTVYIFDNNVLPDQADVLIHASNLQWPVAHAGGILTYGVGHIYMPRIFMGDSTSMRNYTDQVYPLNLTAYSTDYRTKAHEFGHYALNFFDEYLFWSGGLFGSYSADNSLRCLPPTIFNYGFMDRQYEGTGVMSSEMSGAFRYDMASCRNTNQWGVHSLPCWDHLERWVEAVTWGTDNLYVPILKPDAADDNERVVTTPAVFFAGPNDNMANLDYNVGAKVVFPNPPSLQTAGYSDKHVTVSHATGGDNADVQLINDPLTSTKTIINQGRTSDAAGAWVLGVKNASYKILAGKGGSGATVTISPIQALAEEETTDWLYGMAESGGSGVSKVGNRYSSNSAEDSITIEMKKVQGYYPLICEAELLATGVRYDLTSVQPFSTDPTLELWPSYGGSYGETFTPSTAGYEAVVADSLGTGGSFTLWAVDDSAATFFVPTGYVTPDVNHGQPLIWLVGPEGQCEFKLDSTNGTLERALILSSPYPVVRTGLDPNAVQAGQAHNLSVYPDDPLAGTNQVVIRYDDADLKLGVNLLGDESSLAAYHWVDPTTGWVLVGGTVDTVDNALYAPISETGVYAAFTTNIITDVEDDERGDILPYQFELSQNYPNPFNPVTTIEYAVPSRCEVSIEIFNVLGQKVRTLVNETKTAGSCRIEWNGNDDAGKAVSTGVYLYRFQAGDVVQTKKMLLIK
jgi:hypothetical protein